ncbi:MAG: ribonuclease N [Bergeyella sp.]|nr:ribonuclease N [Bergeyella sp.]
MHVRSKIFYYFFIGGMLGIFFVYLLSCRVKRVPGSSRRSAVENAYSNTAQAVYLKTREDVVIAYLKKNKLLPSYYVKKSYARKQGWNPSKRNLCEVLPGKAIGGDRFRNSEGKLPAGYSYTEADVNYNCSGRNADRVIFSDAGDIYLTKDHYKTFVKQ